MTVEPLSPVPRHPVRRPVSARHRGEPASLHRPVGPSLVAPLLRAGTAPDLLDGQA